MPFGHENLSKFFLLLLQLLLDLLILCLLNLLVLRNDSSFIFRVLLFTARVSITLNWSFLNHSWFSFNLL